MRISEEELLAIHRWMVLERHLDTKVSELFRMGKINSMVHSVLGHEAATVGAGFAMRDGDAFIGYIRGKVIYLMRGYDLEFVMAGLMGRRDGLGNGHGMGGSHMMGDPRVGLLPASGCIGSAEAVAVGAALAFKLQHKRSAVLIPSGDGGANRGDTHEAMNMAGAFKLPAVFLFVNNGWALSVPSTYACSVQNLSERAAGYGMPGVTIDGRDVLCVYETVAEGMERARRGEGPMLIEAKVDRWTGHSINDPDIYRTDEERAKMRLRDPIAEYEATLRRRGFFENGSEQKVYAEVQAMVDAAIQRAEEYPEPGPEDLLRGVYETRT